jgi:hypothetical protein
VKQTAVALFAITIMFARSAPAETMLPDLQRDADGGITLYVQNDSPGGDKEANWLPAPKGPFFCAMRLYWPKPLALDGTWKAQAIQKPK